VIHAGIYFPRDLLKSRLCVQGNRLLYEWCRQNAVPHCAVGKLIVATTDEEKDMLERIKSTAEGNGVDGLRLLSAAEVQTKEPLIRTKGALFSPNTGIIDSHRLMQSLYSGGG
jgi:L-2-hydroxyglutarate oxidase LhgO